MKVLTIGGGGREHALAWKIAQSDRVDKVFCAPGNPGIAKIAECVPLGVSNFDALIEFAREHEIGLTVVGPEVPLAEGIVDRFAEAGLKAFGPSAAAAQLEASKKFAKDLMARYAIPTAEYASFDDPQKAIAYVREKGAPIVVKADGLAAGKGVTVAHDLETAISAIEEAMVEGVFKTAGDSVIIEECLVGEEASIFALTDGEAILPLVASQDHKPAFDGDEGPNTGGMGAYSPAPVVTDELFEEIERTVLRPCVQGMAADGHRYAGVLYAGLMMTADGPKVIEFNCRFGDPETQVVLPRMKTDIVSLLAACCDGTLRDYSVEWKDDACVTVVMASGGYPGSYDKGKAISGIDAAESQDGVIVFHAGTALDDEQLVTNGGRVLNVTALGGDVASAIHNAYAAVEAISFEGVHYRSDIGHRALAHMGT